MFFLEVEESFEAGHRLPDYNGPCRRPHGHHWVIRVQYRVKEITSGGMAIDFADLQRLLRAEVAKYDHQSLNTVLTCIPTSENLAQHIFQHLQREVHGDKLTSVAVKETPENQVVYCEG